MTTQHRAWSEITVKSVDQTQRIITGIATTPTADRMDDIVEPKGAVFKLPMPLLWQHDSKQPIGHVTKAKVTDKGIEFEAQLVQIAMPGKLKDRLDEAWQSIESGLVRGISIGFSAKEYEPIKGSYGVRFLKWLWLELSAVTIPANGDCSILAIKSADAAFLAPLGSERNRGVVRLDKAHGPTTLPASREKLDETTPPETQGNPMNLAEQIAAFQAKRDNSVARMDTIMSKAADAGSTLDDHETEEYDGLKADVASIDKHLARLKEHEAASVSKAVPVTATTGTDGGVAVPGNVISVHRNVDKGIAFTRYATALMRAKGNVMQAEQIAKQWRDSTPEVEILLKAAVAAGTTSDSVWAGPLVYAQNMTSEFIEFLRPQTILGRLPSIRRVPFNIRIPRQTAGISGAFVGEGAPIPVQKPGFDSITMTWAKASTIVALTVELVQNSNPSAEALVRQDLADGIAAFLDKRFIDPSYAGVANVSPASVSNGVTSRQASGVTLAAIDADVGYVMNQFATNELGLSNGIWVMPPSTAITLSLMRNAQGYAAFPTLGMNGGTWYGLPVITSNNVVSAGSPGEQQIFLVAQSEILLSDDGQMTIDMSSEASVQMNDAPSAGAQSLVSFWQDGLIGLKVNRWINWAKRRSAAVQYIEQAQRYGS